VHEQQGPWRDTPPERLSTATLISMLQLAYLSALLGFINAFVLHAARKHLASQPALQEKITGALLKCIIFGDVAHMILTAYALNADGWSVTEWPATIWVTFGIGTGLLVTRIAWCLGIGRYVEARDGKLANGKKTR